MTPRVDTQAAVSNEYCANCPLGQIDRGATDLADHQSGRPGAHGLTPPAPHLAQLQSRGGLAALLRR